MILNGFVPSEFSSFPERHCDCLFPRPNPHASLNLIRYDGNWKGGKKHGKGSYFYAGGGRYDGEVF